MENLRDERAWSARISDLRTKLFEAGLMESENRGKLIKLEKELRDEGDKVMKLERDLDRVFSERKHLWTTVARLKQELQVSKARAHNKPLPSENSLDGWILAARERLASKRGTLGFFETELLH